MEETSSSDPAWVDRILDWPWTWLIARVAVVGIFVVSAICKTVDFSDAIREQEGLGLHPGAFWASITILVQIVASFLIITGRLVWLGAGALGVFTAVAAILAHGFWTMQGQERFINMNTFLEHIGLIGGLMTTALVAEQAKRKKTIVTQEEKDE